MSCLLHIVLIAIISIVICEYKNLGEMCKGEISSENKSFNQIIKNNFVDTICEIYNRSNTNYIDSILNDNTNKKCFDNIQKTLNDNEYYYSMMINSGSRLMKLGNEENCKNLDLSYLLLSFYVNQDKINQYKEQFIREGFNKEYNIEEREAEMIIFLSINKIKLGLCLWEDCDEFYKEVFNEEKNKELYQYMNGSDLFNNVSYIINSNKTRSEKKVNKFDVFNKENDYHFSLSFIIFFGVTYILIFAKIIICVVMKIITSDDTNADKIKQNVIKKPMQTKSNNKLNSITETSQDISKSGISNESPSINQSNEASLNEQNDNQNEDSEDDSLHQSNLFKDWGKEKDKTKIAKMQKFLESSSNTEAVTNDKTLSKEKNTYLVSQNIKSEPPSDTWTTYFIEEYEKISIDNLYTVSNHLYNNKNIEALCGLRALFLFGMTAFRVFVSFYVVQWNTPGTFQFYGRHYLTYVKISMVSFHLYVFLDGMIYTFKILSYIDNKEKGEFTIKDIGKMVLNMIPKVCMFFIVFFFFFLDIKSYAILFGESSLFKELYNSVLSNRQCFNDIKTVFLLPYYGFTEKLNQYSICYHFAYYTYNEFLCFIIILTLFAIIYRYKSKIIESIIILLFVINFCGSYVYYINLLSDKNIYIFDYVLGEDVSYQRLPLLLNVFFLGIIVGYIYYYSRLLNISKNHYYPFNFCFTIMHCFTKQSFVIRHLISFVAILMWVGLNTAYFFMKTFFTEESFTLLFPFTTPLKILFVYENQIATLVFTIIVIDIVLSEDYWLRVILSNSIFIIFERCAFALLILNEFIAVMFITMFDISGINWDYENILYLSVVVFVINFFFAVLLTTLYELPLRYLIKKGTKKIQ